MRLNLATTLALQGTKRGREVAWDKLTEVLALEPGHIGALEAILPHPWC